MASCVFDANDGVNFPFLYRDANGSTITNGTLVSVPGFATPVCTFPTAVRLTHTDQQRRFGALTIAVL